jgi:TPR repeat protein
MKSKWRTATSWRKRTSQNSLCVLSPYSLGTNLILYVSLHQPELIMALYEVGNCFFHGWGLPHPDYPMAVSYFKLAAESGDKDAQEREPLGQMSFPDAH